MSRFVLGYSLVLIESRVLVSHLEGFSERTVELDLWIPQHCIGIEYQGTCDLAANSHLKVNSITSMSTMRLARVELAFMLSETRQRLLSAVNVELLSSAFRAGMS